MSVKPVKDRADLAAGQRRRVGSDARDGGSAPGRSMPAEFSARIAASKSAMMSDPTSR
jgi:hypothetical protein